MASVYAVHPCETEISLSRTSVEESYPVALGYTDDGRHVVIQSDVEELKKGDELIQINMLDITHISHRDLLRMILPTKILLLMVRRYPVKHPNATFSTTSCTNAIGTRRRNTTPQTSADASEAMWASSPGQLGLAGWHDNVTTVSSNQTTKKITVIGDDVDDACTNLPQVGNTAEAGAAIQPVRTASQASKEKKMRRRSQQLDRRLPITIGSPINFEHREHMTKQQATVAVEQSGNNTSGGGSPVGSSSPTTLSTPLRRSSTEGFPYRRIKLSRRLSQNLEHRMIQIGSPMNFQHLEHVSAADVHGVLPGRNNALVENDANTDGAERGSGRDVVAAWAAPDETQHYVDVHGNTDEVFSFDVDAVVRQSPEGLVHTDSMLALDRSLRNELSVLEQDAQMSDDSVSVRSSADGATLATEHAYHPEETHQSPGVDPSIMQPVSHGVAMNSHEASMNSHEAAMNSHEAAMNGCVSVPSSTADSYGFGTTKPSLSTLQSLARSKLAEAQAYIENTEAASVSRLPQDQLGSDVNGTHSDDHHATGAITTVPVVALSDGNHTKMVVVQKQYDPTSMSKYDNTDDELPLVKGQTVLLFGACGEDGYYVGQVDGRRGLVPAAYLTSAEDDTHTATPLPTVYQSVPTPGGTSPGSTTPPARTCCVMKVVREYVPSTMSPFSNHEDELPVAVGQTAVVHGRVGDDGYVVAEVDGKCGLVPHDVLSGLSDGGSKSTLPAQDAADNDTFNTYAEKIDTFPYRAVNTNRAAAQSTPADAIPSESTDASTDRGKSALDADTRSSNADKSAMDNDSNICNTDKSALIQHVRARYAYLGRKRSELTFRKGDCFELLHMTSTEWWKVCNSVGQIGYVPANYVTNVAPLEMV